MGLLADMKKCLIWILLLGAGFSLFAQVNSNTSIFLPPVTGIGKTQNDNTVIAQMLTNEIKARHGNVGKSMQEADFILYGTLAPYHEEEQYYHDYIYLNVEDPSTDVTVYTYNATLRDAQWEQVYIFQLILKDQKTNQAILLQNLLYLSIEDVFDYFPLLIYNIFTKINFKEGYAETEDWRNKWLYLRVSFDFPITRYELIKRKDLYNGNAIYSGNFDHPDWVSPLDNMIVFWPGMTVGAEVQLLDWLSIEPNIQVNQEYLNYKDKGSMDNGFINLTAGLQLKFPLKFFRNIMLEPYGAVSYRAITSSDVFDSPPMSLSRIAFGGGAQVGMKGWKQTGSVFIDINYMYYYGESVMYNHYKTPDIPDTEPEKIHYQRSIIGLGIGYKFGVIDRK